MPRTASGLLVSARWRRCSGWVQVWVIVSGLYWNTITFGTGTRNVGMNSTSAPFSTPLIGPPPRPDACRWRRRSAQHSAELVRDAPRQQFGPAPARAAFTWIRTRAGRRQLAPRGRGPRPRAGPAPRRPLVQPANAERSRSIQSRAGRAGRAHRAPSGRADTTPCFSSSRRAAASTCRSPISAPSSRARNAAASAADLMPAPVRSSSRARAAQSNSPASALPSASAAPSRASRQRRSRSAAPAARNRR